MDYWLTTIWIIVIWMIVGPFIAGWDADEAEWSMTTIVLLMLPWYALYYVFIVPIGKLLDLMQRQHQH